MAGFKRLPVLSEKEPQQELGRTQNTLDNLQSCVSTRHFKLFYYIYLFVCLHVLLPQSMCGGWKILVGISSLLPP